MPFLDFREVPVLMLTYDGKLARCCGVLELAIPALPAVQHPLALVL